MHRLDLVLDHVGRGFDAGFYAREYPDLALPGDALLRHYCTAGWLEGRNPHPRFDGLGYLRRHWDVARAGLNPFFHYLVWGQREGRRAEPALAPSRRSAALFGHAVRDWVGALRPVFDAAHYAAQLAAPLPDGVDPLAHFAFQGWRQGLDAAPDLPTAALVRAFPRAVALRVNPLLAQLESQAGRWRPGPDAPLPPPGRAAPRSRPATREEEMAAIRPFFDEAFYRAAAPDLQPGADALAHYLDSGWREGLDPSPHFDTAWYLDANPGLRASGVNPFWHWVMLGRPAGARGREPGGHAVLTQADHAARIALLREGFSAPEYLASYPDVGAAGMDPLEHFYTVGWKEGRNPGRDFDTAWYLSANEDVREAGENPFWHYLAIGKGEGRSPSPPGGLRRRVIEAALPPAERTRGWRPAQGRELDGAALDAALDGLLAGRAGLCVSLSHDCYIRSLGGTQILIADEQREFAARGHAYLHLSPRRPRLDLGEPGGEVQVVGDGAFLGMAPMAAVVAGLRGRAGALPPRILALHNLLGFHEEEVLALHAALAPGRTVFWLHDHLALCEGYTLLRNDIAFCAAPPPESLACRVCAYGATRPRHLARLHRLFEGLRPEVVAPSASALEMFTARSGLPAGPVTLHPHWRLRPAGAGRAVPDGPVRIGFLGQASAAKGWPAFAALLDRFGADPRYAFLHFVGGATGSLPGLRVLRTEVTAADRLAAARLLEAEAVDFLVMPSPWPETFSFAAHEALAAGCRILCLEDSGNIAALVRETGLGMVFATEADLAAFLDSPAAEAAAQAARQDRRRFDILATGTTARLPGLFPQAVPA